jgi:hypothetical protein
MLLRRKVVASLAALATVVSLAACGGSSSSSGVSAGSYVKSICQAIGPFEKDVQSRSSALDLSSITSAAAGKKALQGFLAAIVADTDKAVQQLKAAGSPDVTNGEKISGAIVGAFSQVKTALSQAETQAGNLPTTSPAAFKAAAQSIGTGIRTSMSSIGNSLSNLKSADLENAAKKEQACTSLGAA